MSLAFNVLYEEEKTASEVRARLALAFVLRTMKYASLRWEMSIVELP